MARAAFDVAEVQVHCSRRPRAVVKFSEGFASRFTPSRDWRPSLWVNASSGALLFAVSVIVALAILMGIREGGHVSFRMEGRE